MHVEEDTAVQGHASKNSNQWLFFTSCLIFQEACLAVFRCGVLVHLWNFPQCLLALDLFFMTGYLSLLSFIFQKNTVKNVSEMFNFSLIYSIYSLLIHLLLIWSLGRCSIFFYMQLEIRIFFRNYNARQLWMSATSSSHWEDWCCLLVLIFQDVYISEIQQYALHNSHQKIVANIFLNYKYYYQALCYVLRDDSAVKNREIFPEGPGRSKWW